MAVENQDLKEYEEWLNSQNSLKNKLFSNIKLPQLLLALGGLLLISKLWQDDPNNRIILGVIAGGIIIFILWQGKNPPKKEIIPEHIIKIICQIMIDRKPGFKKEFPPGTELKALPDCKLRVYTSELTNKTEPFSWDVGVIAIYPNGLRKEYVAHFHPYDGIMTAFYEEKLGPDMKKSPDLKIIEKSFALVHETDEQQPQRI